VTTIAGSPGIEENIDGLPANARFATPGDVCVDGSGVIYVADAGQRHHPADHSRLPAAAPSIALRPQSQTVNLGSQVTFTVGVAGTPPFTFPVVC
jgi:sugar lactone lactonase YvrE